MTKNTTDEVHHLSTSSTPRQISDQDITRLSRDALVKHIRFLERELHHVHAATANANSVATALAAPSSNRSSGNAPAIDGTGHTDGQKSPAAADPRKEKTPHGESRRKLQPFHTRLVALKLAYLGKNYSGFEFQASGRNEAVEEVLWRALVRCRLIVPQEGNEDGKIDFGPFGYAKCGRTDKGVSAFGQVISLRLRSSRPMEIDSRAAAKESSAKTYENETAQIGEGDLESEADRDEMKTDTQRVKNWHPIRDEIDYPKILNRLLPPDVRILAWCGDLPEGFDARHSCGERQYKYFFTQPAFAPLPDKLETEELHIAPPKKHSNLRRSRSSRRSWSAESDRDATGVAPSAGPRQQKPSSPPPKPIKRYKEGWLDIEAMREAAQYFVGSHDFRNFCRMDGAKQITEFTRLLFDVNIEEVSDLADAVPYVTLPAFRPRGQEKQNRSKEGRVDAANPQTDNQRNVYPKVYVFNVHGNAFLWHQIRCMIAVLFLVGQGLEKPTIVRDLLDVTKYPRKPQYTMAHDVPLVLWDCIFPKNIAGRQQGLDRIDSLAWVYSDGGGGHEAPTTASHGPHGMYDHLWTLWRDRKMDEILANRLMDVWAMRGRKPGSHCLDSHDDDESAVEDRKHAQAEMLASKKQLAKTYRAFEGGNNARTDGRYIPICRRELQPSFEQVNNTFAIKKGFASSKDMSAIGNWRAEVKARKAATAAQQAVLREQGTIEAIGNAANPI